MPRIVLLLLWLITEKLSVIEPFWLAILGFLFLPHTTLAYVLIHHWSGNVEITNVGHAIILLVAVLMDTGTWGGARRSGRKRDD